MAGLLVVVAALGAVVVTDLVLENPVASGVITAWRGGHLKGHQLGGLSAEEVLALERPAMTYVQRATPRAARPAGAAGVVAVLHPTSGRRARRSLPVAADTRGCGGVHSGHRPSGH